MSGDAIKYDLTKNRHSSRRIVCEAEKIARMANKLERHVADISAWWAGGSEEGFISKAKSFCASLHLTAEHVRKMGVTLEKVAQFQEINEELIVQERIGTVCL